MPATQGSMAPGRRPRPVQATVAQTRCFFECDQTLSTPKTARLGQYCVSTAWAETAWVAAASAGESRRECREYVGSKPRRTAEA